MITDETKLLLEILGEIKSALERIEKAILNGPHITIVPTPVYPPAPTFPTQPYLGDPPGWLYQGPWCGKSVVTTSLDSAVAPYDPKEVFINALKTENKNHTTPE